MCQEDFGHKIWRIGDHYKKKRGMYFETSFLLLTERQPDSIRTKNNLSSLRMLQFVLRKIDQWKYEMCRLSSPPNYPQTSIMLKFDDYGK